MESEDENTNEGAMNSPKLLSEVEQALKLCKDKKATGLDNIPNELLCDKNVINLLHSLFHVCFQGGIVPNIWKKAIIHPIPKTKVQSTDPLKYHGLALQSCIFKVFCNILNTRIVKHFEDMSILDEEQNGFRPNRSCQQHIYSLMTVLKNECLMKKGEIFTAFIDFQKAFDVVNRQLMLCKMREDKKTGPMLRII